MCNVYVNHLEGNQNFGGNVLGVVVCADMLAKLDVFRTDATENFDRQKLCRLSLETNLCTKTFQNENIIAIYASFPLVWQLFDCSSTLDGAG